MFRSATIREGFIAGVLAASAVALWFFVADILAGAPLYTPLLLVTALLNVLGAETSSVFWPIAAYTVFHYAAFIGVGTLVTTLIAASNRDPGYFAGLFLLFAVLEAAFYGYALLLSKLFLLLLKVGIRAAGHGLHVIELAVKVFTVFSVPDLDVH